MKVLRLIEILQLVFRLGGAACHIEVKRRDAFQTPDFAGILLELLLEFIDCLVAIPGIFWSIYAGNALLGICGGQIEPPGLSSAGRCPLPGSPHGTTRLGRCMTRTARGSRSGRHRSVEGDRSGAADIQ